MATIETVFYCVRLPDDPLNGGELLNTATVDYQAVWLTANDAQKAAAVLCQSQHVNATLLAVVQATYSGPVELHTYLRNEGMPIIVKNEYPELGLTCDCWFIPKAAFEWINEHITCIFELIQTDPLPRFTQLLDQQLKDSTAEQEQQRLRLQRAWQERLEEPEPIAADELLTLNIWSRLAGVIPN